MADRKGFNGSGADNAEGAGEGSGDEAATEARAREVGWEPKENFRGDPARWKSAIEFLEYADHVTPVLRKNNQKLFADLQQRDDVIRSLQQQVAEQGKVLKTLNDASNDQQVTANETKMETLRERLVAANEENDAKAQAAIQEEILDLKLEMKAAKAAPVIDPAKGDNQQPAMSAEEKQNWDAWVNDNQWFNDPVMAAAATAIGAQILTEAKRTGDEIPKGRKLLDEVAKRMDNKFHVGKGKSGDKVDEGSSTNSSSGSSGKGGKRYNSLPQVAKDTCTAQAKKFVGPGKRYEKLADWQNRFTELYYSDEA